MNSHLGILRNPVEFQECANHMEINAGHLILGVADKETQDS